MAKKSRVAIVGRANVGKSTLFNTLASGPKALVSIIPGTTRDYKENDCSWQGNVFTLIDTGGLDINPHELIETKIAEQARKAIDRADLILFVVDVKAGVMPTDRDIAAYLRKTKKRVILVVNKADAARDHNDVAEFYRLGFQPVFPVSAVSGTGTGDLLDAVVSRIATTTTSNKTGISVAIIGKPNVGKSSLVNALVGEERSIVHDEPYTTRDTNAINLVHEGTTLTLLDTAGVRRKSKITRSGIEANSVQLSLDALGHADVVLLMTEANKPVTAQDRQLAALIDSSRASVIIIGNKWDLIADKDASMINEFERRYRTHINYLSWAPVILMSAKERTKLTKLKNMILTVYQERFRNIDDNALSKFLKSIIKKHKPTKGRGTNKPYIYRLKQMGTNPPQFAVYIKEKQSINYTYLNYIEKQLREKFGFTGAPIKMWVEKIKHD